MTDTTGDIYYSGQICRVSAALGTGCGKCEKCKAEAEVKEEQLYICAQATEDCNCGWSEPRSSEIERGTECLYKGIITRDVPYTEEPEPKTKRVAVIWFGEVSEDAVKCQLYFDNKHDELTQNPEQDVELIDIERLRYGKPKKGEMLLGAVRGDIIECASNPNDAHRLIIDPTVEPETIDQVLERMPDSQNYPKEDKAQAMDYYKFWCQIADWQKDLKAAQERSE